MNPRFKHGRLALGGSIGTFRVEIMNQCRHCLSLDEALDILRSDFRRQLVRHLLDSSSSIYERDELAKQLHSQLGMDRMSVAVVLDHHHLPMLDDSSVIEYDHRSGTVRSKAKVEELALLLEACERFERGDD